MLNKWIAFLVSRSLEILIIFAVLGLFLFIIKEEFNSMLFYRTCFISQAIIPKLLYFTVPKAEIDRSLPEWFFIFIKIGALIYFTYLILKQCQSFATNLAAYGGAESRGSRSDMAGQASGQGSFEMASAIMSNVRKSMFKATASTLKYGAKTAKFTARATMPNLVKGAASTVSKIDKITNAIGSKMPVRGIGTRIIDDAIAQAQQIAAKDKVPPDRLQGFVRQKAKELLINQKMGFNENRPEQKMESSSTKFALLRINDHNISRRLDKILIEDPMKKQISLIAKDMKKDPNFIPDSEARDKIRERAKNWGIKNGIDESDIEKFLNQSSIKGHIRNSSTLSTSQAASRFAHDKEKQEKFLKNLESDRLERKAKHHDARIKRKDILKDYELKSTKISPEIKNHQLKTNLLQPIGSSRKAYGRSYYVSAKAKQLKNNALGLYHALRRDVANNPTMARRNFKRKIERKERGSKFRDINPLSHINAADRLTSNLATRIVTNKLEKAKKSNKIALKPFGGRNPKKGTQTKEKKEKVRKEIEQLRQDNLTKNPTTDKDKEKWIKQSSLIHAKLIKGKAQKKNHFEFEIDNQNKINKELNSALKKDINYEIKNRDGSIEQERVPIMSKLILIDEETQKANKENKNNTRFAELFTEKYAEKIGVDHFNNLLKVKDKESQEKIINDKDFQDALKEATAALKEIEKSDPDHFPKDFEQSRRDAFKNILNAQKTNQNSAQPHPKQNNDADDDAFSTAGNQDSQTDPADDNNSISSSTASTTAGHSEDPTSEGDKKKASLSAQEPASAGPIVVNQEKKKEEAKRKIYTWRLQNQLIDLENKKELNKSDPAKCKDYEIQINEIKKQIENLNKLDNNNDG